MLTAGLTATMPSIIAGVTKAVVNDSGSESSKKKSSRKASPIQSFIILGEAATGTATHILEVTEG